MALPSTHQPIPEGPEELTVGWLNETLAGRLPLLHAVTVADDLEQGMTADVFRLRLAYAAGPEVAAAPDTLIAKLASRNTAMRLRPQSRINAGKEVGFYRQLAGSDCPLPVPRCYHAAMDEESGHQILLLEDLAPAAPRSAGCTLAEARLAVRSLAAFHGRWWEQDLSSFYWLPAPAVPDPEKMLALFEAGWPVFQAAAGPRLSDAMIGYGEKLGRCFSALMGQLLTESPLTLRHGDFSLGNMLFPTAAGGRFAVIDWAGIGQGKGAWDLAWLLGQSFPIETRRAWEPELLACYLEGLEESGVPGYDADALLRDYRLAIAQRFGTIISSVVALPFTAAQKEQILDVQLPRNAAAISDHGGLAVLDGLGG